jgi:uncharacterized protein
MLFKQRKGATAMTPEERQLITGLFDRMRNLGTVEKDRDAETLINDRVRATPDAPYMLVQSVLVQEQALQQAEARIRQLEEQMRDLEAGEARAPASGGSFLGGLFGGGRPAGQPTGTSVPPIGSRAADFPPPGRDRAAFGSHAGAYDAQPPQAAGGGGGFMRSAMATAAGVAGGMLAAGAIRDLMGGSNSAQASTAATPAPAANKDNAASGTDATNQQASTADAGNNNTQTARDDQGGKGQDEKDDNYQDAYDDSSGDWGDGGDFEV